MSLQLLQPPPVPPQTVAVYPNTFPRPPPLSQGHHSHSSGSFGTVFLVLTIVLAVSAIACCLGRFCNRRSRSGDPASKQDHRPRRRENDIEFGSDGRTRTAGDPMPGNNGGSETIHDKDKAGLGGGFQFQTRARIDEPKLGAS